MPFEMPSWLREFGNLLGRLDEILSQMPKVFNNGKKILNELFEERGYGHGDTIGLPVNVIPATDILGSCQDTLFVAVGDNDSLERRLLEAVEHVSAKCRGITNKVLFISTKWQTSVWLKHKNSFGPSNVFLKIIGLPSYIKLL